MKYIYSIFFLSIIVFTSIIFEPSQVVGEISNITSNTTFVNEHKHIPNMLFPNALLY